MSVHDWLLFRILMVFLAKGIYRIYSVYRDKVAKNGPCVLRRGFAYSRSRGRDEYPLMAKLGKALQNFVIGNTKGWYTNNAKFAKFHHKGVTYSPRPRERL